MPRWMVNAGIETAISSAARVKNWPCAKLITFITPNTSVSPRANSTYTAPICSVLIQSSPSTPPPPPRLPLLCLRQSQLQFIRDDPLDLHGLAVLDLRDDDRHQHLLWIAVDCLAAERRRAVA